MTISVQTEKGKLKVISAFALSSSLRKKISQALKEVVEEEAQFQNIDELLNKLRKKDSVIGTSQGALIAYKTSKGWTQEELSKRTGISQADISKMINGKRSIGLAVAKKLGGAFGVDYRKFI